MRTAPAIGVLIAVVVVLAGCGSAHTADARERVITVPAYDHYPANTITVAAESARSPVCRRDARAFLSLSRLYLEHKGALSAYPSDVAYLNMRQDLSDFTVRGCDPALLGEALGALSAKQRVALVGYVPRPMANSLRTALAAAGL